MTRSDSLRSALSRISSAEAGRSKVSNAPSKTSRFFVMRPPPALRRSMAVTNNLLELSLGIRLSKCVYIVVQHFRMLVLEMIFGIKLQFLSLVQLTCVR